MDGNQAVFLIEFSENQEQNCRKFIQQVVTKMSELAELHVRIALLGDYDISSGAHLTNPAFNRIYGDCDAPGFRSTLFSFIEYSGELYFCPVGWRRISINVASSEDEFDEKYGWWHVAYHGTKHELAATILTSGFWARPGEHSNKDCPVYFTSSIVYASHPRYSEVYQVRDEDGKMKYVQMVLQVRVNPLKIWKKKDGILRGAYSPDHESYNAERDGTPIDHNFPENRDLEWLVKPHPGANSLTR